MSSLSLPQWPRGSAITNWRGKDNKSSATNSNHPSPFLLCFPPAPPSKLGKLKVGRLETETTNQLHAYASCAGGWQTLAVVRCKIDTAAALHYWQALLAREGGGGRRGEGGVRNLCSTKWQDTAVMPHNFRRKHFLGLCWQWGGGEGNGPIPSCCPDPVIIALGPLPSVLNGKGINQKKGKQHFANLENYSVAIHCGEIGWFTEAQP